MKNHQELLKLQAYLDGELPESEARGLVDWLAADPEAAALLAELDSTRGALREFDEQIKLPESRDFYWSKIQRAISREVPAGEPIQDLPVWFAKMRRFLMPAGGVALLVIFGFLTTQSFRVGTPSIETAFSDPGALTYHDYN
jgi:anti-sigma factor RsiW